jgi:hypothetical protein
MIMQKLVSSLLFISLLFICSCDKDTTVSPPDTDTTVETYAKNSSNPYDEVGATHNELLDEILKEVFHDPSVSREDLFKKAFDRVAERNTNSNVSYDSTYVPNKAIFDGFGPTVDPTSYMTSIGMGGVGARYVTEMLDSLTPVNGTPRNSETGCIIIKGIEDRIMNSTTIPDSDKILALSAASVFRHSYLYWEKNLPTWKNAFIEAGTGGCQTCGFWDIAKEDGKGAITGGIGGAAAGAGAGGVGALPGAGIGAAAGAVGQSLAAAIFD